MIYLRSILIPGFIVAIFTASISQSDPLSLPLLQIDQLDYEGAFRLPANTYGSSSLNYSEGPIAIDGMRGTIFIVGHSHHQEIAEFEIPALSTDLDIDNLNMADAPMQSFTSVLDRSTGGNTQNINRIGGLCLIPYENENTLLINAYEYYDAPGDNSHTSLHAMNPTQIGSSLMKGFYQFQGGAGHTSGWISEIPDEWQDLLGGTHITGQSSGIPIISRTSVGPSAFVFSPEEIPGDPDLDPDISTQKLLDFSLANPLHTDLSNTTLDNDLWTHLSRATYGMVVPGTRTYLTLGFSGGHESGVCYKCVQDNGNQCGGYCPNVASDQSQYYWLWDMSDLVRVKNGELLSHEVRPYDYGPFNTPFQNGANPIGGGSFNKENGMLYLSVQKADRNQGTYSNPPVIVAYSIENFVLPVELIFFQGEYKDESVYLSWKTAHEYNIDKYVIQSGLKDNYRDILTIKSKGNNVGGFNYETQVQLVNNSPYYRLKIIDNDGVITYSSTIYLEKNEAINLKVFPNPFTNQVFLRFNETIERVASIHIYDVLGNQVFQLKNMEFGKSDLNLDLSQIPQGNYLLRVVLPGAGVFTHRIIKK